MSIFQDPEPIPGDLPVGEIAVSTTQVDLKAEDKQTAERISDTNVYTVSAYDVEAQQIKQHEVREMDGEWFISESQVFPNVNGGLATHDEAIAEVQAYYTAKANKDGWTRLAEKYPPLPEAWVEHMLSHDPPA